MIHRSVLRLCPSSIRNPQSAIRNSLVWCSLLVVYFAMTTSLFGAWARQESGTLARLRAVYFLNETRGWAVGGRGALLTTVDGGAHWRTERRPTEDGLRDLFFIDEKTGWLVCERSMFQLQTKEEPRSYLLQTDDGGASWRRVEATGRDVDTVLVRVIFADEQHGWTFGEEGALYATSDGGATWTRQRVPTRYLLLGGAFLDATQGWLVGAGATILRTTDGGTEWRAHPPAVSLDARLNAITFADAQRGWAVGARGLMLATTNGGRSWTPQDAGTTADLFDVKFLDAQTGWAAGADGTLLHTTDGGAHWRAEASATRHPLERLCFVSPTRGWAVGFGGTIVAYTPGQARPPVLQTPPIMKWPDNRP